MALISNPYIFETALLPGWMYPCTTHEVIARLESIPEEHLRGLHAIGLKTSTKRDCYANARFTILPWPTIIIFSFPSSMELKMPRGTDPAQFRSECKVELEYGMEIVMDGSRLFITWTPEKLKRFILNHVLPHEIGHHVNYMTRKRNGWRYNPGTVASEEFAEHYARNTPHMINLS